MISQDRSDTDASPELISKDVRQRSNLFTIQFEYSTLYLPVTLYVITQACIIVCDVTRRDTMNNVSIWKNDVDTKCGDIPILLLANKVKDKSYFKGMHKGLFF